MKIQMFLTEIVTKNWENPMNNFQNKQTEQSSCDLLKRKNIYVYISDFWNR